MIKTMGFPSRYMQGPGALSSVGKLLCDLGFKRPAILCDEIVRKVALPCVTNSFESVGLPVHLEIFPGEINHKTIEQCNRKIQRHQPDVVLGLGGGKAVDTAKAAALSLGVPIVVAPTVASNDAPTSRLIVINDENNKPIDVDFLKLNPMAVIVDTGLIVQAPPRFFAAGIGDAVSKKLEAHQCAAAGGSNFFGTPPSATALMIADQCYDVILRHAEGAYKAVCNKEVTSEVEELVEATVLLSGLGFENGGLSLAHSLIRGIGTVPAMCNSLHGEMVAFGALVQMVVEGRSQSEIDRLLNVLSAVKLPVTFEDLGHSGPLPQSSLQGMVEATLAHTYTKNMVPALTSERLANALTKTNEIGSMKTNQMAV